MRPSSLYLLVFIILLGSCIKKHPETFSTNDTLKKSTIDTTVAIRTDTIFWSIDSIPMKLNDNLSHQKGFEYDSVIGVDYVGFNGEDYYYPLNKKGQKINTILKSNKLTNEQVSKLNKILGSKDTYENPRIVSCYEPRLGFIFFKEGIVIGQTQICLSCAQLRSTIRTVDEDYGNLFNQKATDDLNQLRKELGLTSKLPWE